MMAQDIVNVRLSQGLKQRIVLEKVETGEYASVSDYVREIVISDMAQTRVMDQITDAVSAVMHSAEMRVIISEIVALELKKRLT